VSGNCGSIDHEWGEYPQSRGNDNFFNAMLRRRMPLYEFYTEGAGSERDKGCEKQADR